MTDRGLSQNGNIFFLILLGIALFAGISYAVIQGGRSSSASLSKDARRLAAQDMISFATTMQKTVQAMRLRGVAEIELDFSNNVYKTLAGNVITSANGTCTEAACKVFDPGGGNINPVLPLPDIGKDQSAMSAGNWIAGHPGYKVLRVEGAGTANVDLVMIQQFLTKDLCVEINSLLGVSNPSNAPPVDTEGISSVWSGTIATFPVFAGYGLGDNAPEIAGKSIFCSEHIANDYRLYTVLLAR